MKSSLPLAVGFIAMALFSAAPADAAMIEVTLGEQDFNNGDTVFPFRFNLVATGEPTPFDMFRGSDPNTDFSESWTFGYAPIVDPLEVIVSATIEFGIVDHDAAHPGTQLANFGFESTSLTSRLNSMFEASGGGNNEYNIFSLRLPRASFIDLRDGSASFALALQGPTPGFTGDQPNNGAGLDFARLRIRTVIPEPSTTLLLLTGVIGLLSVGRRRRQ